MAEVDRVKISLRFYNDVLDKWTVGAMWAQIVDVDQDLYKLDNIPFYGNRFIHDFTKIGLRDKGQTASYFAVSVSL
jgi:hypothetical protein